MNIKPILCTYLMILFTSTISNAYISNVGIEKVSSEYNGWVYAPAINTINESGWNSSTEVHGTVANTMWQSATGDHNPYIIWNLDGIHDLTEMKIWNHNYPSSGQAANCGLKNVRIYTSTDSDANTAVWHLQFDTILDRAPYPCDTSIYNNPQVFEFGGEKEYQEIMGVPARLVKLTASSCYNYSWSAQEAGLSEVKFDGYKLITNTSVAAVSSENSDNESSASNTINGSGFNFSTGVHSTARNTVWRSATSDLSPWIVWDIGNTYYLNRIKVWNYNMKWNYEYSVFGIKKFDLYVSTDANPNTANWSFVMRTTLRRAPGIDDYNKPDVLNMRGLNARLVKFVPIDDWRLWNENAWECGLSEVQFFGQNTQIISSIPDVIVDMSKNNGQVTHNASGFLHGFAPGTPSNEIVDPLKIKFIRAGIYPYGQDGTGMRNYYDRIIKSGGVLQSCFFGLAPNGNDLNTMTTAVQWAKDNNYSIQWDLFNEPDGYYGQSQAQMTQFYDDWINVYAAVKQADSNAIVVGPSYASFDHTNCWSIIDFLNFAKTNNVLPNILSWHSWHPYSTEDEIDKARQWMSANLPNALDICINEYVYKFQQTEPGRLAHYFSVFEKKTISRAGHACWLDVDESTCNCYDASLDGILTRDWEPRSTYWSYKNYGDITGDLVEVRPTYSVYGLAGKDPNSKVVTILLGRDGLDSDDPNINVRLLNLQSASYIVNEANNIRVKAERIADSNWSILAEPNLVIDANFTVTDNAVTVTLPNFGETDAYVIKLYNPNGNCGYPDTYTIYDLNGDCMVDDKDLAIMITNWLKCTDPNDPLCN